MTRALLVCLLLAACSSPITATPRPATVPAPTLPRATAPAPTAAPQPSAATSLPIFDTHMHYSFGAWADYSLEDVNARIARANVTGGFVSSTPDEGTRMMHKHNPRLVSPVLRPYHGDVGTSNWTEKENIWDYLEERLREPIYKGIGEFHVYGAAQANSPVMKRVAAESVKRGLFLQVHSGADEIRMILAHTPNARIVWAHSGLGESAATVKKLMDDFPALMADTALRDGSIAPGGVLDPEWRDILIQNADRFMVGSDTWVPSRWSDYESIIEGHRIYLRQLPPDVAAKIAHKNAERLVR